MVKIQFNQNQYTVTISPEHIKRMKWKKGTEVYITKHPDKEMLYIEEYPKKDKRRKNDTKRKNN